MPIRSMLLSILAASVMFPAAVLAANTDPRVGTWIERKGSPSYQGLRRSFEALANGLIRVNIALDAQGRAGSFAELTCDGQPYPVQGQDPTGRLTLACRAVDVRTTDFSFHRDATAGWTTSAGREQVSADGQVMTVSAVQSDAKGAVTARIERVFDRRR